MLINFCINQIQISVGRIVAWWISWGHWVDNKSKKLGFDFCECWHSLPCMKMNEGIDNVCFHTWEQPILVKTEVKKWMFRWVVWLQWKAAINHKADFRDFRVLFSATNHSCRVYVVCHPFQNDTEALDQAWEIYGHSERDECMDLEAKVQGYMWHYYRWVQYFDEKRMSYQRLRRCSLEI